MPYIASIAAYSSTVPCDWVLTQSTMIDCVFFAGLGFGSMSPLSDISSIDMYLVLVSCVERQIGCLLA